MSSDPIGGTMVLHGLIWLLAAWFCAAKTALNHLNEEKLIHGDDKKHPRMEELLDHKDEVADGLQVAQVLCCLFAASLATYQWTLPLHSSLFRGNGSPIWAALLVTLLLALFMLIVCIFIPTILARMEPETAFRRSYRLVRISDAVLRPLTRAVAFISEGLLKLFGITPKDPDEDVTEAGILQMVDEGEETGAIEAAEKEMIENIFEFNNLSAEDVMTHRKDVTCIWIQDTQKQILELIRSSGLSRFPVYDEDVDDIIGILNARNYLLNLRADRPMKLRDLLREAYFVPETVQADVLFRDMQQKKIHMAIVVDEYGGFSGVVTMEDLLEEIVGNIYDEFDPQDEVEIDEIEPGLWHVSGAALLEDVAEAIGVTIPESEDYDTIGGLVFDQLTVIPEDGSHPEVETAGMHIRVEKLADHRVISTLIRRIEPEDGSAQPRETAEEENDPT